MTRTQASAGRACCVLRSRAQPRWPQCEPAWPRGGDTQRLSFPFGGTEPAGQQPVPLQPPVLLASPSRPSASVRGDRDASGHFPADRCGPAAATWSPVRSCSVAHLPGLPESAGRGCRPGLLGELGHECGPPARGSVRLRACGTGASGARSDRLVSAQRFLPALSFFSPHLLPCAQCLPRRRQGLCWQFGRCLFVTKVA